MMHIEKQFQFSVSRIIVVTWVVVFQQTLCQADEEIVRIPFRLNSDNNIVVSTQLNGSDNLQLMLHTAATNVMLTESAAGRSKSIQFAESVKLKSWGGEASSRCSRGNRLQLSDYLRSGIDIFEDKNSGKETDGKFGLDLFEGKIIELDFDHLQIVLHTSLPSKSDQYSQLKIARQDELLFVHASCLIEGAKFSNRFLLHSGYAGGILLDDEFAVRSGVRSKIKIVEESILKDSLGNSIQVKKGVMPELALGNLTLTYVKSGFFEGAIGAQKMSIMGCDVLSRFNMIFDIANNDLYLAKR